MQLDNVTYINPSDYPEEMRDAIETLGGNLNSFMEQVVELSRSNIDFENTTQELLTFDVTVGANGIPTSTLNIRTSKKRCRRLNKGTTPFYWQSFRKMA